MSTNTPKQPTDHKKPGVKFKAPVTKDGKTSMRAFTLPPIDESLVEKVPGKYTYAVTMNPDDDEAQMRMAFAYLDVLGNDTLRDALLELPSGEMVGILGRWIVGESEGSSE